jgi:nucleotide-binding universal stress UspA family protein
MSSKILVAATPPEAAADALALGTDLARATHAQLVLAGVAIAPLMAEREVFAKAQRAAMERELSLLVPEDGDVSIAVTVSRSVTAGLHALAEQEDAAVLVMGPSHRGPVERIFQGDLTMSTLHGSPCPIAVAPSGYAERADDGRLLIGVAIDGGEETDDVLAYAATLAEQMDASLQIVTVAETVLGSAVPAWMDATASRHYAEAIRAEAYAGLRRAEAAVGERVATTSKLIEGVPGEELRRVGAGVDLLVMGSRDYGTAGRVLVGSTAARVLHEAPCAVVVLPLAARTPATVIV